MRIILLYCSLILMFTTIVTNVEAQDTCSTHAKKSWILGYESGGQMTLNSMPNSKSDYTYTFTNAVYGKKYVAPNVAVEFELKYGEVKTTPNGGLDIISKGTEKIYNVTVPVTIQYYFLPKAKKLRPFIGAGIEYNIYQEKYSEYNFSSGDSKNITTTKAHTSYASFIITQGVTYDISPKIQVKECIHVVPHGCCKSVGIGFDVGVGFKL